MHIICLLVFSLEGVVLRPKMKMQVDRELVRLSQTRSDTKTGKQIYGFFLALAACNTIVPILEETSDPIEKLIDYACRTNVWTYSY